MGGMQPRLGAPLPEGAGTRLPAQLLQTRSAGVGDVWPQVGHVVRDWVWVRPVVRVGSTHSEGAGPVREGRAGHTLMA